MRHRVQAESSGLDLAQAPTWEGLPPKAQDLRAAAGEAQASLTVLSKQSMIT